MVGKRGGIGRYALLPHTTKRRITTNLITKKQKTKLYGSLTTKEIKKKLSSSQVGGVEMGSWGRENMDKAAAGRPGRVRHRWWIRRSHILVQVNREGQLGGKTDYAMQGSNAGN